MTNRFQYPSNVEKAVNDVIEDIDYLEKRHNILIDLAQMLCSLIVVLTIILLFIIIIP